MTVEQKAEEYLTRTVCQGCRNICEGYCAYAKPVRQAFIDGYHECQKEHEWHDLEKDPTDLPPKMVSNPNFSIEVLSDKGEIVNYNFHFCEWWYWRSGKPIAWCEIPEYKEIE